MQASMSQQSVRRRKRRRWSRLLSGLNHRYDPPFFSEDDEDDLNGYYDPNPAVGELALLTEGIKLGMIPAKQGARMLQKGWQKAWEKTYEEEGFNLERVFWRSVFGVGILILIKIAYDMYVSAEWMKRHPEDLLGFHSWYGIFGFVTPIIGWIMDKLTGRTPEDIEKEHQEVLKALGIPPQIDLLMNRYFPLLLLIPPLVFIFLEFKRTQKGKGLFSDLLKKTH